MGKKLIILVYCLLLPWEALAGPGAAGSLSLDQALRAAIRHNPTLSAALYQAQAAQAQLTQARSAYLPQLSAQASWMKRGGNVTEEDGWIGQTGQSGQTTNYYQSDGDTYSGGLSLSQYIYDFGRTEGTVEQKRQAASASEKETFSTASALLRDLTNAYLEVMKDQELVRVAEESLLVQSQHLEQAQAMYQAGKKPKADLTKAKAELSQARLGLLQARYSQKNDRTELERLMGGPPFGGKDYDLTPLPSRPSRPPRVEAVLPRALAARPDYQAAKHQVAAARAGVDGSRAGYLPSLEAQGSYQYSGQETPLDSSWQAGLVLSWDIFDGFSTPAKISEARAAQKKSGAEMKALELTIVQELTKASLSVSEAAETVTTARTALEEARENLEQAEGRYRAGVGDAVEFSDARVLYTEAQSELVKATYGHSQAWAELEYALGRTPDLSPPSEETD